MLRRTPSYSSHKILISVMLLVSIVLSSCNLQEFVYPNPVDQTTNPTVPNLPQTEVEFSVLVPETTPGDAEILVDILDEVTGLSFNPKRYTLSKVTERLYSGRIPLSVGSIAKYRYLLKINAACCGINTPWCESALPFGTNST